MLAFFDCYGACAYNFTYSVGREQTFERFDLSVFPDKPVEGKPFTQRQEMDMICRQCREWADRYPAADTSDMLLIGQSGLGKTYLMHAMAKRLLDRGLNVLMMSAYRFLDVARKAYFSGQSNELDGLMASDVLLLDDLGSEFTTPFVQAALYEVINTRLVEGKRTVISSNLNLPGIRQRYTPQVASRLEGEYLSLPFFGQDIRQVKKQRG